MQDKLIDTLIRAEDIWRKAQLFSNKDKLRSAEELHAAGVFSFNQLAKICRTNVPYLTRRMHTMHAKGGRFEPEALGVLIEIRRAVLRGETVSDTLIRIATNAGCSISCIGTLTGLPTSKLYEKQAKGRETLGNLVG